MIEVAIAQFEAFQALKLELSAATKKLSDRKIIDKAKGILMKSRGLDEETAYGYAAPAGDGPGQNAGGHGPGRGRPGEHPSVALDPVPPIPALPLCSPGPTVHRSSASTGPAARCSKLPDHYQRH